LTYPTLPDPITWGNGAFITAPQLRADVSDSVTLLADPPMFVAAQQTTGQTLTSGTGASVVLDTEYYDNWKGHLVALADNPDTYYAQFAGWYLCEGSVPLNYTGGTGSVSAAIGGVQNGGTLTAYYGQRINNNDTTNCAVVAKLMRMVHLVNQDYMQLFGFQDTGASRTLQNTVSSPQNAWPYLQLKWVCALSGTANLSVPVNASWPTSPSDITSTFLDINIRDTVNFLIYPPTLEATYNAGTATLASQASIPSTTGITVHLDTKTLDNYNAYSTSTNTWTAPVGGVYYCYGQLGLVTGANTNCLSAGLTVTSSNYFSGTTNTIWGGAQSAVQSAAGCANVVRRRLRLNAGDTIQLAGYQTDNGSAAATINGNNSWSTRLIIVWQAA
jgi:hypothetical protein